MPPVGFEPTISAGERPQTYALDRAATGTGFMGGYRVIFTFIMFLCKRRLDQDMMEIYPFKAYWLRNAPTGLTFKIALSLHTVFMCFVFISEQTRTSAPFNIKDWFL